MAADQSEGRSVKLDRRDHAGDGASRTGLVGFEPATHGGEEADELAEHHVEDGAVVIGEIGGAVEGGAIVGGGGEIFLAGGCDYGADPAGAFGVDLTQRTGVLA